jgi:hypothetical protein
MCACVSGAGARMARRSEPGRSNGYRIVEYQVAGPTGKMMFDRTTTLRALRFVSACALATACAQADPEPAAPKGPLDRLSANRVIYETAGSSSRSGADAGAKPDAGKHSSHLPAASSGGSPQPPAAGSGSPELDAGSAHEDAGMQPETLVTPELLSSLHKRCASVGGSYRDAQCQCPDGQVFGTWPTLACRRTEPGTSSCNSKGYVSTFKSGGASGLRRCLVGSVLHVARSALIIGNAFPDELAEPLATWLDANTPRVC